MPINTENWGFVASFLGNVSWLICSDLFGGECKFLGNETNKFVQIRPAMKANFGNNL